MIRSAMRTMIQIAALCAAMMALGCVENDSDATVPVTVTSSSTGGTGGEGGALCATSTDGCSTTSTTTTSTTTTTTSSTSTGTTGGAGGAGGEGGATSTTTTTGNGGSGGEGSTTSTTSTTSASTGTTGGGGEGGQALGGGGTGGVDVTTGNGGSGGSAGGTGGTGGAGGQGGEDPQGTGGSAGGTGEGGSPNTCPDWQPGNPLSCGAWTNHVDSDLSALYTVVDGAIISDTDVVVLGQAMNGDGQVVRYTGSDFVSQTIPSVKFPRHVRTFGSGETYIPGSNQGNCRMIEWSAATSTWITVPGTPTIPSGGSCVDVWQGSSNQEMFLLANGPVGAEIYRGPKNGPWIKMALPTNTLPVVPEEMWGSSSGDVYVVGYYFQSGGSAGGALLHYDGNGANQWEVIPIPANILTLTSVSGVDACGVTVGGWTTGSPSQGVTLSKNGQAWEAPVLHPSVNALKDVRVRALNQVLVVGSTSAPFNVPQIGLDNGQGGLVWTNLLPAGQFGNVNAVVTSLESDLVFILGDGGSLRAMSAIIN